MSVDLVSKTKKWTRIEVITIIDQEKINKSSENNSNSSSDILEMK